MKAVVAAFNQEKALVGAFSVITNLRMEIFEALLDWLPSPLVEHVVHAGHAAVAGGVRGGAVEVLEAAHLLQAGHGVLQLEAALLPGPGRGLHPQLELGELRAAGLLLLPLPVHAEALVVQLLLGRQGPGLPALVLGLGLISSEITCDFGSALITPIDINFSIINLMNSSAFF